MGGGGETVEWVEQAEQVQHAAVEKSVKVEKKGRKTQATTLCPRRRRTVYHLSAAHFQANQLGYATNNVVNNNKSLHTPQIVSPWAKERVGGAGGMGGGG